MKDEKDSSRYFENRDCVYFSCHAGMKAYALKEGHA